MNRYPVWKYAILVVALLIGVLYTLPNFFGEAPPCRCPPAKSAVKVDRRHHARQGGAGAGAGRHQARGRRPRRQLVKVRLGSTDAQLKAKDVIQKALAPDANDPPTWWR
jgi:preprotein translocase subunit SecD